MKNSLSMLRFIMYFKHFLSIWGLSHWIHSLYIWFIDVSHHCYYERLHMHYYCSCWKCMRQTEIKHVKFLIAGWFGFRFGVFFCVIMSSAIFTCLKAPTLSCLSSGWFTEYIVLHVNKQLCKKLVIHVMLWYMLNFCSCCMNQTWNNPFQLILSSLAFFVIFVIYFVVANSAHCC